MHYGLTFILFLFTYGLIPIYAQTNISTYLMSNNIKGFIKSYNNNKELAIESLVKYSLGDTINAKQIWYNQTIGNSINPFERSSEGADRFYTSLKLKSYYWILNIYKSNHYNCKKKEICVFIGKDNDIIFDYESLSIEKENIADILNGEHKNQSLNFQYRKKASLALKKLNESFENWCFEMKKNGLDYMREQNIGPIKENKYRIFSPDNFKAKKK